MRTTYDLRPLLKHAGSVTGLLVITCQFLEERHTEEQYLEYLKNYSGIIDDPTNADETEASIWFKSLSSKQRLAIITEAFRFGKLLNSQTES